MSSSTLNNFVETDFSVDNQCFLQVNENCLKSHCYSPSALKNHLFLSQDTTKIKTIIMAVIQSTTNVTTWKQVVFNPSVSSYNSLIITWPLVPILQGKITIFTIFYIHPKYNYFSTTSLTLLYNQLTALVTKLVMWLRCTKMLSTKLNETAKYTYTIWYANGVRT